MSYSVQDLSVRIPIYLRPSAKINEKEHPWGPLNKIGSQQEVIFIECVYSLPSILGTTFLLSYMQVIKHT